MMNKDDRREGGGERPGFVSVTGTPKRSNSFKIFFMSATGCACACVCVRARVCVCARARACARVSLSLSFSVCVCVHAACVGTYKSCYFCQCPTRTPSLLVRAPQTSRGASGV